MEQILYDINENIIRINRSLDAIPHDIEPLESTFYIFAIKMSTEKGEIRRKLEKDKVYYLLKGFEVYDDKIVVDFSRFNRPVFDFYLGTSSHKTHVSVSAVVGENGSGKSSLIEFEIRLLNNLAAAVFGEYSKEPGWEHLHFINDLNGELFYLMNDAVYKLIVKDRRVKFVKYKRTLKQDNGCWFFETDKDNEEIILSIRSKDKNTPFKGLRNKNDVNKKLSHLFYSIVLNQSAYAYNTNDFYNECNSEEYETKVRKCSKTDNKGRKIAYSAEDKCWLNGLFHKNDGYQIPIVLSPYRFEGNFDINRENELAYERLISILVFSGETFRVINDHLLVNCFVLKLKDHRYDIDYVHSRLGYKQFSKDDYESMKKSIIDTWLSTLELNNITIRECINRELAINYLVYKTLKIAATYDGYEDYRQKYFEEEKKYDDLDFRNLVINTIINRSHVSNKLYRTFAYLLWDIYEVSVSKYSFLLKDVNERWASAHPNKVINKHFGTYSLVLQSAIPPPFYEMSIELMEINTHEVVPFETLSSGEKQQAYTISSILYHLENIDSVGDDMSNDYRIKYNRVHLVLEEVELYFHPQLQKEFVKNLLGGLRQMNFNTINWIDIRMVTHSPFVLSDIPTENVLMLRKNKSKNEQIYCFGANIHDMLRNTFFLKNGTCGDFSSWLIKRIAQSLRVHRWTKKLELPPDFFPSLKGDIKDEYIFLNDFKKIIDDKDFNQLAFDEVYGKDKLLRLINMIEEPIAKRVLLDDYRLTFPEDKEGFKRSLERMIVSLQNQLNKLNN